MRRVWFAVVAGLAVAAVAGCGMGKAKAEAQLVAEQCLDCIQRSDYQGALALYSSTFYTTMPRDKWLDMLQKVNAKLGPIKSYQLVGWRVFKGSMPGAGSGTFVELRYQVQHEKYPAEATFVVHKPSGGTAFKISGHHINSAGLLSE